MPGKIEKKYRTTRIKFGEKEYDKKNRIRAINY